MILTALALAAALGRGDSVAALPANRLAKERSRYLLQHATNPVDWYPWGDEAFRTAREQHKLIFLSIGYSTCHWCHRMEAESFSDDAVAALMNRGYVSIKVDREERPDVDTVYIAVAQKLMTDPGWPLNVILTPDGQPFFATTYLPKERLTNVLTTLARTWSEHPDQITSSAALVMKSLTSEEGAGGEAPGTEALTKGYEDLALRFDTANGGFLPAPKFPAPHQLMFLLRYWRRTGDAKALAMVETTLQAMRRGALFDGKKLGFRRYAEDAEWRKPHLEKMLYDQALLALCYVEAFQATGKAEYARTAREVFTFVLRDERAPNGLFFAAEDADRGRDEKLVADWNGLMIAALAAGASALDEPSYGAAAQRAADALLSNLRRNDGRLLHQAGQNGFLDDYAFTTWGLLNLYEATFDIRYLQAAISLQAGAARLFRDATGRFYVTASDGEQLLVRPRLTADAAIPSGSSVQAMNLLRLARITMNDDYEKQARQLLEAAADEVRTAPSSATHLLSALDFQLGPSYEIVLAGRDVSALRRAVFHAFVPNKVVLHRPPGAAAITRIAPYTEAQTARGSKATAYVCTAFRCKLPTNDPAEVAASLRPPSN